MSIISCIFAIIGKTHSSFFSWTLWEARDHPEDPTSITTEGGEHRGIRRQVNRGSETVGWITVAVPIR